MNLKHELAQFTGSDQMYFHAMNRNVQYSEGVRFFAQNAGGGAYWLLDILATQPEILNGVKEHGFCIVLLKVVNGAAVLNAARDYNERTGEFDDVVYTRTIDFTDCPEGDWKFYFIDRTIILPSEY